MAEVLVADVAGTCFGVARALEAVRQTAASFDGPVMTLGPLIHNPRVVVALEEQGVRVTDDPHHDEGTALVIRAHGVSPQVEATAREHGTVVDATCPLVKRVQNQARAYAQEGLDVVIVGEKGHPEVIGIQGNAAGSVVVGSVEELEDAELGRSVGVVCQTTQAPALFEAIVDALESAGHDVKATNTICDATQLRQDAARELAASCDVMVVLGGRNSGNTRRLAQICSAACPQTHHVEAAGELEGSWFADAKRVGITAGASTPPEQIEELRQAMLLLVGEC